MLFRERLVVQRALVGCGRPCFDVQVSASPLDLTIFQQLLKCMPRAGWRIAGLLACRTNLGFAARLVVWLGFTRRLGVTRAQACGQVARVGTLRNLRYTAERLRLLFFGVLMARGLAGLGAADWQRLRRVRSAGVRLRAGIKFGKHE